MGERTEKQLGKQLAGELTVTLEILANPGKGLRQSQAIKTEAHRTHFPWKGLRQYLETLETGRNLIQLS